MVLVYLPAKLGDFVRANVDKDVIYMEHVGYTLDNGRPMGFQECFIMFHFYPGNVIAVDSAKDFFRCSLPFQ